MFIMLKKTIANLLSYAEHVVRLFTTLNIAKTCFVSFFSRLATKRKSDTSILCVDVLNNTNTKRFFSLVTDSYLKEKIILPEIYMNSSRCRGRRRVILQGSLQTQ